MVIFQLDLAKRKVNLIRIGKEMKSLKILPHFKSNTLFASLDTTTVTDVNATNVDDDEQAPLTSFNLNVDTSNKTISFKVRQENENSCTSYISQCVSTIRLFLPLVSSEYRQL